MKRAFIRVAATLALLLTLGAVFGGVTSGTAHAATVTPNINNANCDGRADLFQVYYSTGELCYANAGYTPATINDVYEVCAGNNSGYYDVTGFHVDYGAWSCAVFSDTVTFYDVDIY